MSRGYFWIGAVDATELLFSCVTEVRGFDAEDELLENFEIQQGVDGLVTVLAIDFHNAVGPNVPKTLDYTIRSSQQIQNKLYSHDSDELSTASDRLIQHIPIVPLQMCLDDAFIDLAAPNRSYKPKVRGVRHIHDYSLKDPIHHNLRLTSGDNELIKC